MEETKKLTDREIIDEQIENLRELINKIKVTGYSKRMEKMVEISREIRTLISDKNKLPLKIKEERIERTGNDICKVKIVVSIDGKKMNTITKELCSFSKKI
ncbi:MAG: hypothetical protein RR942_06060 [Romboutsia sp.]